MIRLNVSDGYMLNDGTWTHDYSGQWDAWKPFSQHLKENEEWAKRHDAKVIKNEMSKNESGAKCVEFIYEIGGKTIRNRTYECVRDEYEKVG